MHDKAFEADVAGTEVPAYRRSALNPCVGAYFSARHERVVDRNWADSG
jgi:hypothetical protein